MKRAAPQLVQQLPRGILLVLEEGAMRTSGAGGVTPGGLRRVLRGSGAAVSVLPFFWCYSEHSRPRPKHRALSHGRRCVLPRLASAPTPLLLTPPLIVETVPRTVLKDPPVTEDCCPLASLVLLGSLPEHTRSR